MRIPPPQIERGGRSGAHRSLHTQPLAWSRLAWGGEWDTQKEMGGTQSPQAVVWLEVGGVGHDDVQGQQCPHPQTGLS